MRASGCDRCAVLAQPTGTAAVARGSDLRTDARGERFRTNARSARILTEISMTSGLPTRRRLRSRPSRPCRPILKRGFARRRGRQLADVSIEPARFIHGWSSIGGVRRPPQMARLPDAPPPRVRIQSPQGLRGDLVERAMQPRPKTRRHVRCWTRGPLEVELQKHVDGHLTLAVRELRLPISPHPLV